MPKVPFSEHFMAHGIPEPISAMPIDYVEFQVRDVAEAKRFYGDLFGWTFEDYGEGYAGFNSGKLNGGFERADAVSRGGPLVVLYSTNLESLQPRITQAGGRIVREIFSFPGGRRFHFADPSGNELAAWSDR